LPFWLFRQFAFPASSAPFYLVSYDWLLSQQKSFFFVVLGLHLISYSFYGFADELAVDWVSFDAK
jgi:hypothetical protein